MVWLTKIFPTVDCDPEYYTSRTPLRRLPCQWKSKKNKQRENTDNRISHEFCISLQPGLTTCVVHVPFIVRETLSHNLGFWWSCLGSAYRTGRSKHKFFLTKDTFILGLQKSVKNIFNNSKKYASELAKYKKKSDQKKTQTSKNNKRQKWTQTNFRYLQLSETDYKTTTFTMFKEL